MNDFSLREGGLSSYRKSALICVLYPALNNGFDVLSVIQTPELKCIRRGR